VEICGKKIGNPGRLMENLSIYLKLIITAIKSKMEYKITFGFFVFAIIIFYFGQLGVILVVMNRFKTINGWTLGEMAFLYGLLVFSQGISFLVFNALNHFERFIIQGEFDRVLTRPLNPLIQVLCSDLQISSLAHFIIGVTAIFFGSASAGLEWSFGKIFFLALVIGGAVLILGGIRIIVSAVAFWTIRNRALVHIFVYSSKEFILYPVSIYNPWVQWFLTFIFPLAFINFYPAAYFLHKSEQFMFHPILQFMTPLVGLTIFFLSLLLWRYGINRYQSTGN
jgi:ABC-2 type transport system permease protein